MANRTRLFKKFPRTLVELRQAEFDRERNLHDTVEQNIGMLFPELVVLGSEFERDGYRPDTVAFDKKRNTFAIIEYKNRQDSKVLDQASAYLVHMNRNRDSFRLLYRDKIGGTGAPEFDWKGAYAVIVSPEFTRIQIDSAQNSPSLTLYAVSVYEDNIISLTRVAGDEKITEPDPEGGGAGTTMPPKPAAGTDSLYSAARTKLLSAFPGMADKKMKAYDRFEVDGRLLCTMGKQKSKIWLHYSGCTANPAPDQAGFVEFVEVPGWGLGRWRSAIRTLDDFDRALSILKGLHGKADGK